MTRLIEGRYRDADKCYSWAQAADEHEPIRNLFPIHSDRFIRLNAKLRLSDKAWRQLCAMNDFDRGKVAEELLQIVASPTDPLHSDASRRNALQRLQRVRYPFKRATTTRSPMPWGRTGRYWRIGSGLTRGLLVQSPVANTRSAICSMSSTGRGMPGFRKIPGSSGRIAKR